MQPGISSFAFGWAAGAPAPHTFTTGALIDFALRHHVPVIQFGDNLPLHNLPANELTALAHRASAAGIAIETGARGLTSEHLERYIAISRAVDARFLRFVIDATGFEPSLGTVAETIRGALPALRAARLVLGIENHDRFTSASLRQLVEAIASEQVGICLDTANSLGAGEGIGEVLAQLAPVCVNLHVKDFAIERLPYLMGFTVTGRSLRQGMLPLDQVIRSVARHGRCASAIVETWPPPESDLAATLSKEQRWAEESITVLRETVRRLAP